MFFFSFPKKKILWRLPIDMIESAWEKNQGRFLYQLDSDTKKLKKAREKNMIES